MTRPRPRSLASLVRRLGAAAGAIVLVAIAATVLGSHRAEAATPTLNPSASILPPAAFGPACYGIKPARMCDTIALKAINSARARERLHKVVLPRTYESWSVPSQLIWISNSERTARHLPAMPSNPRLRAAARSAAKAAIDPTGPSGYWWGSDIASGYATPLAADFVWMYDDGPGGQNTSCTATVRTSCWGHRDNILLRSGGMSGAGVHVAKGRPELTLLLVADYR